MAKCGCCGKFLSSTEGASCSKCRSWYHRVCVDMQAAGPITTPWHCLECRKSKVRESRVEVASPAPLASEETHGNLMDTSPINSTALDTTQELNLDILRAELNNFKEEFLKLVRNEFQQLRDDLSEVRSSLHSTNDKMSELENRITILENKQARPAESSEVNDIISQLRNDINDRDQELLGNDIQISNIPETSGENPTHTVMLVASKMGIKLRARDVVSAERVGGRRINATQSTAPVETRPRFLVVRLARRDLRDELLEGARVRRGMTTADLDLPGPAARFYVNERLTKVNRELFRSAREAGSRLGWQFVWAKRGRILARYKPGDAACHIRCEADLLRTFGPTPEMTMYSTLVMMLLIYLTIQSNATETATYTTKYDGIDLDEILNNERLLTGYVNCLMDNGPCTADGKELKKNIPDAIDNDCKKCTERQRDGSDRVMHYLIDHRPDDWTKLEEKYNSDGSYKMKYLSSKPTEEKEEKDSNVTKSDEETKIFSKE